MSDQSNDKETPVHNRVPWEADAREKFEQLIAKVPTFLRGIAEQKVGARAEAIARDEKRALVIEKDMVDAFFKETPFGFHGPLKDDMAALQIDYTKYGHPQ